jgi:hypothetical protein
MALCSCGSSYTYTFTRQANGATDIDVRIAREGTNLKGWALAFLLGTFRERVLKRKFEDSVKAIEARGPGKVENHETNHPIRMHMGAVHKCLQGGIRC